MAVAASVGAAHCDRADGGCRGPEVDPEVQPEASGPGSASEGPSTSSVGRTCRAGAGAAPGQQRPGRGGHRGGAWGDGEMAGGVTATHRTEGGRATARHWQDRDSWVASSPSHTWTSLGGQKRVLFTQESRKRPDTLPMNKERSLSPHEVAAKSKKNVHIQQRTKSPLQKKGHGAEQNDNTLLQTEGDIPTRI